VDVVANAFCEGDPFAIAAEACQVGGGVEMVNTFHFLLDDWTGIEVRRYVVASGADEFDAALVGLVIWFCADECG